MNSNHPKIDVIIPFVSRKVAREWKHSCDRLLCTIASILQLPSERVSILVVGHEFPDGFKPDERCHWLPVSFPAPNSSIVAEKVEDKGLKVREGVRHVFRNQSADWVMFMDADDFVSKSLLEFCDFDSHEAICLRQGYSWKLGAPTVERLQRFDQICGSSWLMKCTPKLFPTWLGDGGERVCDQAHNQRTQALLAAGIKMQKVQYPSAVYTIGHAGNTGHGWEFRASKLHLRQVAKFLRSRMRQRRVSMKMKEEFGLH